METPRPALIALGSNLGSRRAILDSAVAALAALPETRLVARSSWVETAPVGGPPQGPYLNGAVALETRLSPEALLAAILEIERAHGRVRDVPWGPRTLDLDLLAWGDLVLDTPDLVLPHPRMHQREFVLAPLVEVAPDWVHPVLGRSVREMLEAVRA